MDKLRIYKWGGILAAAGILLLLLRGCGSHVRYHLAESDFDRTEYLLGILLDDVLDQYDTCCDEKQIELLHDGYLRDGTLALIDSLDDRCAMLVRSMSVLCPQRHIERLAERICRHMEHAQRANAVELPMLYQMKRYRRIDPPLYCDPLFPTYRPR